MTAERLHNAQIAEGLGAGPNRLTLGRSYSEVPQDEGGGLGSFWGDVGRTFQKIAFVAAAPILAPTLGVVSPKLFSKASGGMITMKTAGMVQKGEIAAGALAFAAYAAPMLPGVGAAATKLFPWTPGLLAAYNKAATKVGAPTTQGMIDQGVASAVSSLVPGQSQGAPSQAANPSSSLPTYSAPQTPYTPTGGGGYAAYSSASPAPEEAGILGSMPSWVLPVVGGLLLLKFAVGGQGLSQLMPSAPARRRRKS